MYSERVVESTILDFARREGWEPEPHSVGECDDFCAWIDTLTDVRRTQVGSTFFWKDDKAPTASKIKFIRRWIENEQFMCFADASYFATRYGKIRDAEERIIHFDFRLAQRIFLAALAECDDLQIAIQLFILKARQLGISTVVALFFLHRILFRSNTYAIMASVSIPQSEKLASMIDTTWSRLPFWLPPQKKTIKAKEPRWYNGSLLSVQAGNQEVGIAQGTTPSCVHISELGDYTNPKRVLEEGLFPACHPTRSLFMVLEGTGSMATIWQKEKWEYYVANWGKGGRFRPFFIPPACARDLYPHADWLRAHPIPEDWSPMDRTRKMRRRAELFVRQTDYLSNVLGRHWEMDREFQYYWECLFKEAVASHSENEFLSQYAPTPEDAFQSKDSPVFQPEVIEVVSENRQKSYMAYAITGRTILMGNENRPYEPNAEDVDQKLVDRGGTIHLRWQGSDENEYHWDLIPLKPFDDSKDDACFDKLLVFRAPEEGMDPNIGIDTAHGLNTPNEDRASLTVHQFNQGRDPDEQLAAFTSLRVNSPQMARIAAAVACLYGTNGNGSIISKNPLGAKFIIEQTRKAGDECMNQLKIMGFLDHHIMLRIDKKGNVLQDSGHQEGWYTRGYNRSYLLERFVDAVNTNWLILHDPIVIRQLASFVRKYKERGLALLEHAQGDHDDNIFSNAMAWTTGHELENTALRIQSRYPLKKKEEVIEDQWCERIVVVG
jgi:hypothetical protein